MPLFPSSPLQTPRLALRELNANDWPQILHLRSDPRVNEFVKRPLAKSQEDAVAFIENTIESNREGITTYWGIVLPVNDEVMGCICLWKFSEDRNTAEVGYDLSVESQGRGYMTEAMSAVLEFAFGALALQEIEAFTQSNNFASLKLLRKFGFRLLPDRRDETNTLNVTLALNAENKQHRRAIFHAINAGR